MSRKKPRAAAPFQMPDRPMESKLPHPSERAGLAFESFVFPSRMGAARGFFRFDRDCFFGLSFSHSAKRIFVHRKEKGMNGHGRFDPKMIEAAAQEAYDLLNTQKRRA